VKNLTGEALDWSFVDDILSLDSLKMKILIPILFVSLALTIVEIEGWCVPWKSGSSMNVCKQGRTSNWRSEPGNCINVNSGDACINLTGGPFIAGYSAGSHECNIYSEVKCKGDRNMVDQAGYSGFSFTARSLKCPCV